MRGLFYLRWRGCAEASAVGEEEDLVCGRHSVRACSLESSGYGAQSATCVCVVGVRARPAPGTSRREDSVGHRERRLMASKSCVAGVSNMCTKSGIALFFSAGFFL